MELEETDRPFISCSQFQLRDQFGLRMMRTRKKRKTWRCYVAAVMCPVWREQITSILYSEISISLFTEFKVAEDFKEAFLCEFILDVVDQTG